MSLLDKSTDDILVYPEEVITDVDGNIRTRPSKVPYRERARMQPMAQSGTSSRRAEQDNEGFESEQVYSMRLPRGAKLIGAQAEIGWKGERWAVFGYPFYFHGSPRTSHVTYTIKRF